MSAVTMRRKNMNRIELVPLRSSGSTAAATTAVGGTSLSVTSPTNNNNHQDFAGSNKATTMMMINSARGGGSNQDSKLISPSNSNNHQNRPSTSSSTFSMTSTSVKSSSKIVETKSSLIKKANDRFTHKKRAITDRNSAFPGVNEFRFAREKEDIMESVLDKINTLSNHSYFTSGCSDDGKSSQNRSDLFILGKSQSVHSQQSTESHLSTQSQYQRQYVEWKNGKEINESSKQIAESIKKREGHVPFGTFGVFQTGNSIYKRDFVPEDVLKKRMNEIEIEESQSYILNNPWERRDEESEKETEDNVDQMQQPNSSAEDPITSNRVVSSSDLNQQYDTSGDTSGTVQLEITTPRSSAALQVEEDLPPEQIGEEEVVLQEGAPHNVTLTNVTKPTDFDGASVFNCSTHHSLYSRRYGAPSTACSSTSTSFSIGKKGIKGGKAKYMPRPTTSSLLIEPPRLKTPHSNQSPSSPLSKSLNIDEQQMRNSFTPISSRHNFPQSKKNTFNSIIRSSDLLSTTN